MTENYLWVYHKNRRKHNQHFKHLFFKLNPHSGKPTQTVFFLVVSSLEMQSTDQSTLQVFFTLSQKKQLTNLQK